MQPSQEVGVFSVMLRETRVTDRTDVSPRRAAQLLVGAVLTVTTIWVVLRSLARNPWK